MQRILQAVVAIIIFASGIVNAQNHNREFEISLPETKISGSFYNKIIFLDVRTDTTQMGIVQTGALNRKANVVAKMPLALQLNELMHALVDSTAKDGELFFQLRQLSFAEITGAVSEKGYFYFRAKLYVKSGSNYIPLSEIDTAIILKSSWDVTKGLLKNGSRLISSFISNSLLQTPSSSVNMLFSDVVNIDSIEKNTIKIYSDTALKDGIYLTWNSFKNQGPDHAVLSADIKNGRLTSVKRNGEDNKPEKIKSKNVYAVIYNNHLFIATDYGYYPLEKRNNDFFFTGKAKVTANTGDVIAASLFFGIIGGLLASGTEATFDMRIDHLNGGFIRLKERKEFSTE
jgi:hypothetical protein